MRHKTYPTRSEIDVLCVKEIVSNSFIRSFIFLKMNIINPKKKIPSICLNETSPDCFIEKQLLIYFFSKESFFLNRFKNKWYERNIEHRSILKIHHSSVRFACFKVWSSVRNEQSLKQTIDIYPKNPNGPYSQYIIFRIGFSLIINQTLNRCFVENTYQWHFISQSLYRNRIFEIESFSRWLDLQSPSF